MKPTIEDAAKAYSDLTVFAAVKALLEGGTIYTVGGEKAAQKIINICSRETVQQVRDFDCLVRRLNDK